MAQYIDEFLSGRTQKSKEEFRARPIEKQYASIIQWRRSRRLKDVTPRNAADILSSLSHTAELINNASEISDQEAQAIYSAISSLNDHVTRYMEQQRERRIRELEQQSQSIAAELAKLRGF